MLELAFQFIAVASFSMAFSLPIGRFLMMVALIMVVIDAIQKKEVPYVPLVALMALAFFVAAMISTFHGVNPDGTWHNLRKPAWYIVAIPAFAILVNTPARLCGVLGAYSVGCGVLAVSSLGENIWKALGMLRDGTAPAFSQALITLGSMTDAQRFMVGILCTCVLLVLWRKQERMTGWWWVLLAIQTIGLLLTFKRGSLICLLLAGSIVLVAGRRWKYLLGIGVLLLALLAVPSMRHRIGSLSEEINPDKGGRMTMWFKVAPAIHKEYPWFGIGWRALTNEMMVSVAPNVERNRNHLHSNIAEILVETGLIGFAIYAVWMLIALWNAIHFAWVAQYSLFPADKILSLGLLLALFALLCNGVVEFNFGDGEIVVVYAMLMGCVAAGLDRREASPLGVRFTVR